MAASAGNGRFTAAAAAASASSSSPTSRYWQAPSMERRVFASWSDFFSFLDAYQARTCQVFTRRTGTTVKLRNQTLTAAGKGNAALIPEHYEQYSRTMHCTSFKVSAEGKRKRRDGESFADCKAQINATLKQEADGAYRVHVTKAFLVHNHPLNQRELSPVWLPPSAPGNNSSSAGNSSGSAGSDVASSTAVAMTEAVHHVVTNAANKRLRVAPPADASDEPSSPAMSLRDFLARMKAHQPDGATVESCLARYVKEFDDVDGNVAKIFVDDQKVLSCITMQTKNMRKAFDVFPEVLRVECTRPDESGDAASAASCSSYNLFSLLAHDTFGMWQFVQHAVVESGRADSWTAAMTQFKAFNPKWESVRAVVIERESAAEVSVLRACFPQARVLLSQFHVVKDMHEAIAEHGKELSAWHKDRLSTIVQLLVYAPTELVYRASFRSMVDVLADETHPFLEYFNKTWDSCRDMWSTHRRENVTTFGANEARRLEPTWREIQASVGNGSHRNDMTLDETIVSIQFYQAMVERNYMSKLRRTSSSFAFRTSTQAYDDEMKLLAATVSPHACQLVYPQYAHALGRAQYRFCEPSRGTFFVSAVVLNDAFCDEPGKEFCVEEKLGWQCSCAFMVNHHLPCRHVFYIRRIVRCDSIVPIKSLERRWVLRDVSTFFDSNALTSDAMRLHVRDYKDESDGADKDPMHDENRNTIVVPPGSWEKFVAAMDVGKRVSLRLMQLDPAEFDRALRYYRIVEQNFGGRTVDSPAPVNGAAAAAAATTAAGAGVGVATSQTTRQAGVVGRPPLHRTRLAPKPAAAAASKEAAAAGDANFKSPPLRTANSSVSPRQGGDIPSLASLNPPVIDLQDESEAEEKDGGENEDRVDASGEPGAGDEAAGEHEDGGEATDKHEDGGGKGDADPDEDYDEEYAEEEEEEEEYVEDDENEEEYQDQDENEPAHAARKTRSSGREAAGKGSAGSSSPSSAVLPRRSSRSRS